MDSGTSPQGSWKIEFTGGEQDGVKVESVAYTLEGEGRKLGFAVMCRSANGNKVYSGAIMAARTSAAVGDGFWDSYKVSAGQESVLMDNALSGCDATEDGWHRFLIKGGYNYLDVKELMNATVAKSAYTVKRRRFCSEPKNATLRKVVNIRTTLYVGTNREPA